MMIIKKCVLLLLLAMGYSLIAEAQQASVLIFSKTSGYRHESIENGAKAVTKIAQKLKLEARHTENAAIFHKDSLLDIKVVVFLNTTGDILNDEQQDAFKAFIQQGGRFIGIHAAADTEYKWPWYGRLVGGYFSGHPNNPNVREAVVHKTIKHDITNAIPNSWEKMDEWYNYKDINPAIEVLQNLDESTYEGGDMGEEHPITWFHEYDGGKAFYTGMGHTKETYSDPIFQQLIIGAFNYMLE